MREFFKYGMVVSGCLLLLGLVLVFVGKVIDEEFRRHLHGNRGLVTVGAISITLGIVGGVGVIVVMTFGEYFEGSGFGYCLAWLGVLAFACGIIAFVLSFFFKTDSLSVVAAVCLIAGFVIFLLLCVGLGGGRGPGAPPRIPQHNPRSARVS